jgi:hypothetical protein
MLPVCRRWGVSAGLHARLIVAPRLPLGEEPEAGGEPFIGGRAWGSDGKERYSRRRAGRLGCGRCPRLRQKAMSRGSSLAQRPTMHRRLFALHRSRLLRLADGLRACRGRSDAEAYGQQFRPVCVPRASGVVGLLESVDPLLGTFDAS